MVALVYYRKCELMKYVIISGGHIDDAFALEWLQKNKYDCLIAADSGVNFLHRNELVPNIIAGDFDSADDGSLGAFSEIDGVEILRLNTIKDDTDTEFVIREAIRRGATEITLLGATGTRLDHVLANVYLLGIGLEENVQIEMLDAYNRIRMITGEVVLRKAETFGEYVSLLPVAGRVKGVSLKGFKYPLENVDMQVFSSLGISNEILEEEAYIQVKEGYLILFESQD